MKIITTTERLIIREITLDDMQSIFDLNADSEVVRYTSDPAFKNMEEVADLIENNIRYQYRTYGMGRCAVIDKESGLFMGWCGLKFREGQNETDLGYRFMKKFWGKGYATEAAKAFLTYGFTIKNLERIIGCAIKENIASIEVLKKCGMTFCRQDFLHGHDALVFELFNSDYLQQ